MSDASAQGAAYDATVDTTASWAEQSIAETRASVIADAERAVSAAQAKIDRQREHLAGAEQALADAEAALCALQDSGE